MIGETVAPDAVAQLVEQAPRLVGTVVRDATGQPVGHVSRVAAAWDGIRVVIVLGPGRIPVSGTPFPGNSAR